MHSAGPSEEVAGHETNIPDRCVGRFDSLLELRTYVVYMWRFCSLTHILVVCLSFCHVAASQVDEHSFLQVSRSSECEFHVWHGFFVVVCLGLF